MRHRHWFLPGVLACVMGSLDAQESRPSFSAFEHRFRPSGSLAQTAEHSEWSWPKSEHFRRRFDRYDLDARTMIVFEADLTISSTSGETAGTIWAAAQRTPSGYRFHVIRPDYPHASAVEYPLSLGGIDVPSLDAPIEAECSDLKVKIGALRKAVDRRLPHDLWADWVYATVLRESDPDTASDPRISAGFCSQDEGPIYEARAYAVLAREQGRLGRFLRLRLQIATDAFERLARSSTGDAQHKTEGSSLVGLPIDVDRFFIGLVIELDPGPPPPSVVSDTRPGLVVGLDVGRPRRFSAQRLGRAIAEAGRTETLAPTLRRLAQDPDLDDWNRFRAAAVLVHALAHDPSREPLGWETSQTRDLAQVTGSLKELRLPPIARRWLGLVP